MALRTVAIETRVTGEMRAVEAPAIAEYDDISLRNG